MWPSFPPFLRYWFPYLDLVLVLLFGSALDLVRFLFLETVTQCSKKDWLTLVCLLGSGLVSPTWIWYSSPPLDLVLLSSHGSGTEGTEIDWLGVDL